MSDDSRRPPSEAGDRPAPGPPARARLVSWGTRDRLRTYLSYNAWVLSFIFAAAGVILGFALPDLDRSTEIALGLDWDPVAATAALGGIIAGSIALIGFVYTVALLVLQLQYGYSPRLIRLIQRNAAPKIAVGVLTFSTIYALLVLRAIDGDFVPQLSTTLALIVAALSIFGFLFSVGELFYSMRTSDMISKIGTLTRPVIAALYPERASSDDPVGPRARPPTAETRVISYEGEPGVVVGLDTAEAVRLATATGSDLYFEPAIGQFVHPGSVLFRIDGRAGPIDDDRLRRLAVISKERTFEQDPAYGFRLLVDMANSALSPAVNDPTTAVQVLDEIGDLLRMLAPRRMQGAFQSGEGAPWLCYRTQSWDDYVRLACSEIRHYGADQPQVSRRMRAMLEDLKEIVPNDRRPALERQLELLKESVAREFSDPQERAIAAQPDRLGFGEPRGVSSRLNQLKRSDPDGE